MWNDFQAPPTPLPTPGMIMIGNPDAQFTLAVMPHNAPDNQCISKTSVLDKEMKMWINQTICLLLNSSCVAELGFECFFYLIWKPKSLGHTYSHWVRESTYSLGFDVRSCSVTHSYPTLCDSMDGSPPGSSVHGIFQARILEWVAISSSKGSSQPRDLLCLLHCRWILYHWATGEGPRLW